MNAPLYEHIRKSPESVTLDEKPQGGFHRRYKYSGGKAGCAEFGVEQANAGDAT